VANAACYQNIFGKCDKGEHCRFSHKREDGINMIKRYIKDAMRAPFGGYDFIKREIDTLRAAEQPGGGERKHRGEKKGGTTEANNVRIVCRTFFRKSRHWRSMRTLAVLGPKMKEPRLTPRTLIIAFFEQPCMIWIIDHVIRCPRNSVMRSTSASKRFMAGAAFKMWHGTETREAGLERLARPSPPLSSPSPSSSFFFFARPLFFFRGGVPNGRHYLCITTPSPNK